MAPAPPKSFKDSDLIASDDEDEDFLGGDSSASSDDSGDERPAKKTKGAVEVVVAPVMSTGEVNDLWASFNAPDPQPSASASTATVKKVVKKIKIQVAYEFVGETVLQEKEVEEDSVEGQAWLESEKRKKDVKGKGVRSAEDDLFGPEEPQEEKVGEMVVVVEKPKAAPPRRAKGGLAGMAAGLGKPPKLNTLEKSKLDWNKFVVKEDMGDDLTKARKSGFLDQQDFLARTEERREDDWDKNKSKRDRRP